MAESTNHLSVFLIKDGILPEDIAVPAAVSIQIEGVGTFYAEPSKPHSPGWLTTFFKGKLGAGLGLVSSSAKGLLVVSIEVGDANPTFALSFGYGRHLLQDDVYEERFGLKVVLNSVHEGSLRSIDKLNLGSFSKQSREQIGREGEVSNFGIDVEQDLVKAVTGRSKIDGFGRMISGKDAFATSAKFDVENIKPFLAKCWEQFRSMEYQAAFDWIDQLEDVRSTSSLDELNTMLVASIVAGDVDRVWMVPPDIVNWSDVSGFKYGKPVQGELHNDLAIVDLVAAANEKEVTLEWLRQTNIYLVSAQEDKAVAHWPAFRCIYAELMWNGSLHVLNAGKWYKVADDFVEVVNGDFDALPNSELAAPVYDHVDEGAYNIALAASIGGAVCLDADVIQHGGGKSSIEVCDVLTPARQFVHVKRYSGSAELSHLFSQGAVAAELFVSDPSFRQKVNEKLPAAMKLDDVAVQPDAADYEVTFAIVSRSAKPLDIPFFSKVTLRNAVRRLRGFRYRVSKHKIPVAA